jgi:hypothetical protein
MKPHGVLVEGSFTAADVPKRFYVSAIAGISEYNREIHHAKV